MIDCSLSDNSKRTWYRAVVELILVVHVDDILVNEKKDSCDELHHTLNDNFRTETLRELKWYLWCAVECDWQQSSVTIKEAALIEQVFHATQRVRNHFL